MILAAIHQVPPVIESNLDDIDPQDKYRVVATRAQWFKWMYGVREWTVTVTATETYPEGSGDPVAISDHYIIKAYKDRYIDGTTAFGDPQDSSPDAELFENIIPYGNLGGYDYRGYLGGGVTTSTFMSRACWNRDGDDYYIYLRMNAGVMVTFVDENIYDADFTLRSDVATMVMGDKTWPISTLVKDVPVIDASWWVGTEITIEATRFWGWAEGYPSPRFDTTTGENIASPFSP